MRNVRFLTDAKYIIGTIEPGESGEIIRIYLVVDLGVLKWSIKDHQQIADRLPIPTTFTEARKIIQSAFSSPESRLCLNLKKRGRLKIVEYAVRVPISAQLAEQALNKNISLSPKNCVKIISEYVDGEK